MVLSDSQLKLTMFSYNHYPGKLNKRANDRKSGSFVAVYSSGQDLFGDPPATCHVATLGNAFVFECDWMPFQTENTPRNGTDW